MIINLQNLTKANSFAALHSYRTHWIDSRVYQIYDSSCGICQHHILCFYVLCTVECKTFFIAAVLIPLRCNMMPHLLYKQMVNTVLSQKMPAAHNNITRSWASDLTFSTTTKTCLPIYHLALGNITCSLIVIYNI